MAYQSRRRGGGGGSSIITRLFGGGDTAEENIDIAGADTPGEVPYQYRGDPNELLGREGFVQPSTGKYRAAPYSDIRGFMGRIAGDPNNAEALNLQLAQQGMLGKQATTEKLSLEEGMTPIKSKQEKNTYANSKGLTPEQVASMSDDQLLALRESARALAATSQATTEEQTTKGELAKKTRDSDIYTGEANADIASNVSERKRNLSRTPQFGEALDAATLAGLLQSVAGLQKTGTTEVGPGELKMVPSPAGLFSEGSPSLSLLPQGGTARGTTVDEQPVTQQIGGQSFNVGTRRNVTPPSFTPIIPTSVDEINALKGRVPSSPSLDQSLSTDFGPMKSTTTSTQLGPTRFQGGNVVSDIKQVETPEAKAARQQREAQEAMQILQQLLSNPYTPNRRNF